MAKRGQEMILGITRDPVFGPMLMVGLGGIHVEVLKDVAFAPVPLDTEDALALIGELKGAALLDGVRGAKPADKRGARRADGGAVALRRRPRRRRSPRSTSTRSSSTKPARA